MISPELEAKVNDLRHAWGLEAPEEYTKAWKDRVERALMKYQQKSFTLPAAPVITQAGWDAIWASTPPATPSEKRSADPVAVGEYVSVRTDGDYPFLGSLSPYGSLTAAHCPNCHCRPDSYRHIETCIEPGESD